MIGLEIGLKHQNQDKLEQHVLEVSDPSHARHGQYLSAVEVQELVAPADETIELVKNWLLEHKITAAELNPAGDSFLVNLPVEKIEELLDTTYSVFRHEDGTEYVRAPEWSLPRCLHEHIDVIQPTNSFFRLRKEAISHPSGGAITLTDLNERSTPGAPCNVSTVCNVTGTNLEGDMVAATTLTCLRCLYGTIDYTPQVPKKNMIGVTNYLNEVCMPLRCCIGAPLLTCFRLKCVPTYRNILACFGQKQQQSQMNFLSS